MKKTIKQYALAIMAVIGLGAIAWAVDVTVTVLTTSKSGATMSRTSTGLSTSNTYKFRNNGKVLLLFEKTGSGTAVITVVTPGTSSGLAIADVTVNIPEINGDVVIGPFQSSLFNDSSADVSFTIPDTAGLSFAAVGF